jgi:hypothetical protein
MKRPCSYRPQLEALEDRALPSSARVIVLPFLPAPTPPVVTSQTTLSLGGTIFGTWHKRFINPDLGMVQVLTGSGTISPLGLVQASGTLHTPGFVATGHTTGSVTLSNSSGSVTLQLVGPTQRGFSKPPASFHFTITSGTGAFAGDTGSGTASFHERPGFTPHCPPGALCPLFIVAPSFTLTFPDSAFLAR